MKYNQCLDIIENNKGYRPSHAEIARALNCKPSAMTNRAYRDSNIQDNEVAILEKYYAMQILTNTNCVDIDYFEDVFGSCGTGLAVFSESKTKISVAKDSILDYSSNKLYSVINSRGDSMQPSIRDNDQLVVEQWNGEQIIDNRVYVISYDNDIFIKRLVKNITQIIIKSDNPLYDPIKIDAKDDKFKILGRIVGQLRKDV